MIRREHIILFLVACAGLHLLLIFLLPRGATGDTVAHLDAIQIQLLIDSYRDQLTFFKVAAGTVCGAETSAIVWLTKRLLDEMSKKKGK